MIDRLLIRRTQPIDPRLDQWMLDRWSDPSQHVVRSVYRKRLYEAGPRMVRAERVYRSECDCGWRSIEYHAPTEDRCPVGDALADRLRRLKKPGERAEWELYRG